MKPVQRISLLLLVVVAGAVLYLAMRNRQAPYLPADEPHSVWTGAPGCLACHGPDAAFPQSRNHPIGNDCLRCHARR